jgi:hypothetical protein
MSTATQDHPPIPLLASFADVALIDASACAAVGDMSVSWWHEEVRAGRAPQPAIRKPRCTRWRLTQVRDFWAKLPSSAAADTKTAERVTAQAKRASDKAKAKRAAAQ